MGLNVPFWAPKCSRSQNEMSHWFLLRLYIRSSALPCVAAVGLGWWNCEHVILRVAIWINIRIYDHDETWKVWRDAGCRMPVSFTLPSTAVASVWFWMYFCHPWNTSDNLVQWNFLFQWLFFVTGRDGTDKRTNGRTDIGTDRLFSENIILDAKLFIKQIKRVKRHL